MAAALASGSSGVCPLAAASRHATIQRPTLRPVITDNPMPRRAFTLIELLVVIAIMVTLMSLIMGGVMLARRSAMRAKAVASISALASAIDQYRSLNNTYPELKKYDLTVTGMPVLPASLSIADGDDVYAKVFSSSGAALAVTAITDDGWTAVNQMLVYQLGDLIRDQAKDGKVLDAWKTPLRYRPSKWYPYSASATVRIDSENPPGADSFQLWSSGSDTKDDANPGEGGDDIPQWAKLP